MFAYSGVQRILCYVFCFVYLVLCTISCQFLLIVHFWLPLRYSLMLLVTFQFQIWSFCHRHINTLYIVNTVDQSTERNFAKLNYSAIMKVVPVVRILTRLCIYTIKCYASQCLYLATLLFNNKNECCCVSVWWCLTPLSTVFQLYSGGQFYWWRKPEDHRPVASHWQTL